MKTVINVLGGARTGTTMLDVMLGNAPNAFSCGEVYSWFRPWHKQHYSMNYCACEKIPCPIWQKFKGVDERIFHKMIFDELKVDFVIDSSKNLAWIVDMYNCIPNDIRIINLVIWKNPLDLFYSYWKRGIKKTKGRHSFISNFIKYYKNVLKLRIPFISINYKQLVENPSVKLKNICNRIGMPYFLGKEKFWEKEHHHIGGSYGIRQQIKKKQSTIYKKEMWPDEFIEKIKHIKFEIQNNNELLKVIQKLEENEVNTINSFKYFRPESINKTSYYYFLRAKQVFRYYFRQNFEFKKVSLGTSKLNLF